MSNFQGIRAALRLMAAAALSLLVAFGASAQTVRYIHTDALGSPELVTDKDRNVVERNEYEPYGSLLNHQVTDGPGYTGHVMDASTGLSYMQQRYHDPSVGRFLSADPIQANPNTGNGFNRYKYASNNSYRYIDPDGRADLELFSEADPLFPAAHRFDMPGWFTVMGHAGVLPVDNEFRFRDSRGVGVSHGERLTVPRLVQEIQKAGFDGTKNSGVFLGQCQAWQSAPAVAAALKTNVMAATGYVFTQPNNYSNDITYKVWSAEGPGGRASGSPGTFNVYNSDGSVVAAYSKITMKADGSVWATRAEPETGSLIPKTEKLK